MLTIAGCFVQCHWTRVALKQFVIFLTGYCQHLVSVPFILPVTTWLANHQSGFFAACQDSRQAAWPLLPAMEKSGILLACPKSGTTSWWSLLYDDWLVRQCQVHATEISQGTNAQASDLWISKAYLIQFQFVFLTCILVLVVLLLWNGRVKVLPWLCLAAWFMDLACTSTWLMKDFLVGPTGQSKWWLVWCFLRVVWNLWFRSGIHWCQHRLS